MFGLGTRGLHKRILHELFYVIRTHEETKETKCFASQCFAFGRQGVNLGCGEQQ